VCLTWFCLLWRNLLTCLSARVLKCWVESSALTSSIAWASRTCREIQQFNLKISQAKIIFLKGLKGVTVNVGSWNENVVLWRIFLGFIWDTKVLFHPFEFLKFLKLLNNDDEKCIKKLHSKLNRCLGTYY